MVFDGLVALASLEAPACTEALALAKDLHVCDLVIGSDCLEVISKHQPRSCNYLCAVLREIDHTRREFDDAIFGLNLECPIVKLIVMSAVMCG